MEKIYFVGINGIGMSGLAKIMKSRGHDVAGADPSRSYVTEDLERLGIPVYAEHKAEQMIGRTVLVASSAIRKENPEYCYAKEHKIPILKRGELLADLLNEKTGIAVAGTHGKTTTSSMLGASMLSLDPTIVVGGILPEIASNAKVGKGEFFIAEADESDNSFLYMKPKYSIITNIEEDHLETHGNLDNIKKSFLQFVEQTEQEVLVCVDCVNVRSLFSKQQKVTSYALQQEADVMAKNIRITQGKTYFEVWIRGKNQGEFYLQIPGQHNVSNALPVIYYSLKFGLSAQEIQTKLAQFKGSKRRYDILYEDKARKIKLIDDYAHHPTEIQATLRGARSIEEGKIIAIFQPHRYSRIQFLLEKFSSCFQGADELILLPIYSAGEKNETGICSEDIVRHLENLQAQVLEKEAIMAYVKEKAKEGQHTFLFMGAGDISSLAHQVANELEK